MTLADKQNDWLCKNKSKNENEEEEGERSGENSSSDRNVYFADLLEIEKALALGEIKKIKY